MISTLFLIAIATIFEDVIARWFDGIKEFLLLATSAKNLNNLLF